MRYAGYVREETLWPGKDTVISVEKQIQEIRCYAKEYGFEETTIFQGDQIEELLTAGMKRSFDIVILFSYYQFGDSFAQNNDILEYTFFPAGIHFAVIRDDFCSINKSIADVRLYLESKMGKVTNYHRQELTKSMQKEKVLSHTSIRYGFQFSDDHKRLVHEPETANVVRRIYELYLEGQSYKEIAELLNKEKIPSPQGHKMIRAGNPNIRREQTLWREQTIARILTNTIYDGYGTTYIDKVPYDMYVLPILDEGIFDKVQQLRESKQICIHRNSNLTRPNPLSNRIFDSATGNRLMCVTLQETGTRVFTEEKRDTSRRKSWLEHNIPYKTVMEQINKSLQEERKLARAYEQAMLKGRLDPYVETALLPYRDDAKRLFEQMDQIAQQRIEGNQESDFEALEEQFHELRILAEQAKLGFGVKNPWILRFRDIRVPKDLSRADVNRWIDRVTVQDYETVVVTTKDSEWKAILPDLEESEG